MHAESSVNPQEKLSLLTFSSSDTLIEVLLRDAACENPTAIEIVDCCNMALKVPAELEVGALTLRSKSFSKRSSVLP